MMNLVFRILKRIVCLDFKLDLLDDDFGSADWIATLRAEALGLFGFKIDIEEVLEFLGGKGVERVSRNENVAWISRVEELVLVV